MDAPDTQLRDRGSPAPAGGPGPAGTRTPPVPGRRWTNWLLLALLLATFWWWRSSRQEARPDVDYSTVYSWTDQGNVDSVVVKGETVEGTLRIPQIFDNTLITTFHTQLPANDDTLVPLLRTKGARIRVASPEQPFLWQLALSLLPWILIIGGWLWLSRRTQRMMIAGGPGGMLGGFLRRGRRFEKSAEGVTFAHVAGLAGPKRDLQEIVLFLKEPERFRKLGGKVPHGVLLVGPPGTGKTLLARAVAGEADVPFYSISASEFIELFVGVGAARVRDLFEEAKKNAPAIIFIDELDAVGRARGAGLGGGHDEREQTLNQLLSEMDGFDRNELVVVLAATNRPDVLDPALLRPGRFDRRVVVDLPELAARRDILGVHVKGKPLARDVDLDEIARTTPGFSGADLANLVNEAALHATRRRGDDVTRADFAAAYDKIVLGDPREGRLSPDEKARVAAHEAGHAVLAWAVPKAEPLRRVSILPRGHALGATEQMPPEDRHILARAELDARLVVLLGGYASEQIICGDVSSGAENDLRQATALASKMVAHFGMSDQIGPAYYQYQEEHAFLGHRLGTEAGIGTETIDTIEREARALLRRALNDATSTIQAHRAELDRLRTALLEKETLSHDELDDLLGSMAPEPKAIETPLGPVAAHA